MPPRKYRRHKLGRSPDAAILGWCVVCHAHVELPCVACQSRRSGIRPTFAESPVEDLLPILGEEEMAELGRQHEKSLKLKASQGSVHRQEKDIIGVIASRVVTVFSAQRGKGFA